MPRSWKSDQVTLTDSVTCCVSKVSGNSQTKFPLALLNSLKSKKNEPHFTFVIWVSWFWNNRREIFFTRVTLPRFSIKELIQKWGEHSWDYSTRKLTVRPWKTILGRWFSFWNGPFSADILILARFFSRFLLPKYGWWFRNPGSTHQLKWR